MQFTKLASLLTLLATGNVLAAPIDARSNGTAAVQALQDKVAAILETKGNTKKGVENTARTGCPVSNARVRREWSALSKPERKEYIKAVQCLRELPSKSDPEFAPGARTCYDDFVTVHINNTRTIHATGNFLTYHRYLAALYEEALINECGYKGAQPYWNWLAYQDDLHKSPMLDGSDTSMGGNGEYFAHNGSKTAIGWFQPGKGGGCIASGPFKGAVANLGPVAPTMNGLPKSPSPLAYNPRCLRRDFTSRAPQTWFTVENFLNLTTGAASHSIAAFQTELQGRFGDGFLGMHTEGHQSLGADAADLFSSINDPVLFLHHAMLDRVDWMWQALHSCQSRAIAGTRTMGKSPPSDDAQVSDELPI
ncbi:Tyrosinase-like protein orsC [Apiospora phragmitis]|uniref:Tyrosinase-like protein orsC n=1 Tax=Apiospora phragmitis TaxID=2905665 RepID=A0ABR1SVI4_9PEZI